MWGLVGKPLPKIARPCSYSNTAVIAKHYEAVTLLKVAIKVGR